MEFDVIIVASGVGSRFGGDVKKQFLELDNIPIIAYTINAFEQSKVDNIYLVTGKDDIESLENIVKDFEFKKVKEIFTGGSERYLSVYNGLIGVEKTSSKYVLIHDGVRPFINPEKINEFLEEVVSKDSCILATKNYDTLKLIDDKGYIRETLDRRFVLSAQTPQGFVKANLIKFYKKAIKEEINFTDEASVMEYYGQDVFCVNGQENNIKITEPSDFKKAMNILGEISHKPSKKVSMESTNNGVVTIYTDGACSGNPGKGAYGIVMFYGDKKVEFSDGFLNTTNNRMELLAVIEALTKLNRSCKVTLYSDSKYVIDSITKGWVYSWAKKGWKKSDGKIALNIDLWERLLPLLKTHDVNFVWVKGHADNEYNERCDFLAREHIINGKLQEDRNYL